MSLCLVEQAVEVGLRDGLVADDRNRVRRDVAVVVAAARHCGEQKSRRDRKDEDASKVSHEKSAVLDHAARRNPNIASTNSTASPNSSRLNETSRRATV
jgi:hypothetical protein